MPYMAKFPSIGAIQNFDQTDLPTWRQVPGAIDWDGRRLFIFSPDNSLVKVDSLDTFATVVAAQAYVPANFAWGAKFGPDGMLYGAGGAGPNDARINKMDPAAPGTVVDFFGAAGGGFQFETDATHWAVPSDMDIVMGPDGMAYAVSTAFNASQTSNEVSIINLTTMTWTGVNFFADTPRGVVTRGLTVAGVAHAFLLSTAGASETASFYDVTIQGIGMTGMTKVATISATDLGPGWTHIDQTLGMMLDETDGNVMAFIAENALQNWGSGNNYSAFTLARGSNAHDYRSLVNGNIGHDPISSPSFWLDLGPSGPVEQRLVKININTGRIMWTLQGNGPPSGLGLTNSNRVRFGLYCYMDFVGLFNLPVHQIRTLQGTDTPQLLNTISQQTQFFSDTTGEIVVACGYSNLGNPIPHGTTPNNFGGWAMLGSVTPPFQPPGGLFVLRHLNQALHYQRVRE